MSDISQGAGWWIASDGKWYPPDLHPDAGAPSDAPRDSEPATAPGPGWWIASDGEWYPPELHPDAAGEGGANERAGWWIDAGNRASAGGSDASSTEAVRTPTAAVEQAHEQSSPADEATGPPEFHFLALGDETEEVQDPQTQPRTSAGNRGRLVVVAVAAVAALVIVIALFIPTTRNTPDSADSSGSPTTTASTALSDDVPPAVMQKWLAGMEAPYGALTNDVATINNAVGPANGSLTGTQAAALASALGTTCSALQRDLGSARGLPDPPIGTIRSDWLSLLATYGPLQLDCDAAVAGTDAGFPQQASSLAKVTMTTGQQLTQDLVTAGYCLPSATCPPPYAAPSRG